MDLDKADRKAIVILPHVINADMTNGRLHKKIGKNQYFRSIDWFALKTVDS
jgi:hypothetical protein